MGKQEITLSGLSLLPPSARKPELLRRACRLALGAPQGPVAIVILDRKAMLKLNIRFLGHRYDTDVIAFPYERSGLAKDEPFGDVYISSHQARVQAKDLKHSVLEEVLTLVIHGTLHLRGWDDSTPKKKAAMFREQSRILGELMPIARSTLSGQC